MTAPTVDTPLTTEERRLYLIESRHLVETEPRDFRGRASVEVTWAADLLRYEATLVALESQLLAARREVERLTRARAAAIASLAKRDALGAMAALTMSRDHPDLFDRSTFEDAPAALAATPEEKR